MLKGSVKRKGKWTTLPKQNKSAAHRTICTCCHQNYGYLTMVAKRTVVRVREHIDHTFPRRWIEQEFPVGICPRCDGQKFDRGSCQLCANTGRLKVDPHQAENLVSICNICHGKKKIAEDALFRGDAFEFIRILKGMRYPLVRVFDMAHRLGIRELEGWTAENNPLMAKYVSKEQAAKEFLKLS
jgi:hypothetical protein